MQVIPDEYLAELKNNLLAIIDGTGGIQDWEDFMILQKLVQRRSDLTSNILLRAHRVQLEILVMIQMGIQAFLHPNVSLSQTSLIEIFLHKRCRNLACQNQLPLDDCTREICSNKNGFCNACMCVICSEFDLEVNTCRWIGYLEANSSKNPELQEGQLLAPQEVCKQIAQVVQEAVRKMKMVANGKFRMLKKAHLALESCDGELEAKTSEAAVLKHERQEKAAN
ncbi:hypothetical protein Nepgr_014410 [Nepenthes gracilis]|uniref:Oberon-like PHD finger domain-containing protein n=1 Tax=Nepenthes gracilis TaxID=150966 RepID=A0AAD3XQ40_NEPGR|nr:hypothetical protein Nepgr_014410 [Nepenthes gracilis]